MFPMRSTTGRMAVIAVFGAASLAVFASAGQADAEVKAPDCAALEAWSATIDKKDRWQPLQGQRAWLPRAFEGQEFEGLFGEPALNWTADETQAIGAHIYECAKTATKEKRYDAQKALNLARNFIVGALKGVLARAERVKAATGNAASATTTAQAQASQRARAGGSAGEQDQKLEAALAGLLALPDSPELMRGLAMLQAVDFADPESYGTTFGRVGSREGRLLLQTLRNLGADTKDPRVAPRLAERLDALRDGAVAQQISEISGLEASTRSLKVLDRKPAEIRELFGPAPRQQDVTALGQAINDKRAAIQGAIIDRAKALVDRSPANAEGLARVGKIIENTAKSGVTQAQFDGFLPYARTRQHAIADAVMAATADRLDGIPDSLAGVQELRNLAAATGKTLGSFGSAAARQDFAQAVTGRMTAIGRAALPEFEQALAALPEDASGLEEANSRFGSVQQWPLVAPELRDAYVVAAKTRRDAIAAALAARAAARRQQAIEAGGDPALVGRAFVDPETFARLEFRDEKMAMFTIVGLKAPCPYQIDGDDIIVKGPHGTLVLTRRGDRLQGMGMNFKPER